MHNEAALVLNTSCTDDPSQRAQGVHTEPSALAYDKENDMVFSPPVPTLSPIAFVAATTDLTPAEAR